MSRYNIDTYVLTPGSKLRKEADELTAELKVWLTEKLRAGHPPIPLQRALLDVANLAAGHGEEGEAITAEFRKRSPE